MNKFKNWKFIRIFKLALIGLVVFSGCSVKTVNRSKNNINSTQSSALSTHANNYFWKNFHAGNYANLDSVLFYLMAAYNENPNHVETAAHLGFTHIWALSERDRNDMPDPRIVSHATLSAKYFGEAYQLKPDDMRILGFLADVKMVVANTSDDKKLSKEGYFDGIKSIRGWKEFNYFTVGYVLSQLDHTAWQYKKGLKWQWKTLDACYHEKFDRANPDIKKYLPLEEQDANKLKTKRACWNSWIAPHNVEGYYLNMGDMLVKSGDWQKGIQIYNLAKQVPQYDSWAYQDVLEKRIKSAEQNIQKFRTPLNLLVKNSVDNVMLINSEIACMACHYKTKKDYERDYKRYKLF